ncbi:hypothetical protein Dda3937_02544 [Dickeya dadantii 3937]|uniref:Uncharacterized protein n=1 Tax=Dickeya dadantii (strain 3937) TaxID=198628 RepID=E0SB16_DICD3|nr:hypothetical protein Dda3937_02544 [Dickeya dadantii 3937]
MNRLWSVFLFLYFPWYFPRRSLPVISRKHFPVTYAFFPDVITWSLFIRVMPCRSFFCLYFVNLYVLKRVSFVG